MLPTKAIALLRFKIVMVRGLSRSPASFESIIEVSASQNVAALIADLMIRSCDFEFHTLVRYLKTSTGDDSVR